MNLKGDDRCDPNKNWEDCKYLSLSGGKTPLMIALKCYNIELVEFLLNRTNIDINAKADDGTTALIQIASSFAVKTRRLK